jgi:hypothetical protein
MSLNRFEGLFPASDKALCATVQFSEDERQECEQETQWHSCEMTCCVLQDGEHSTGENSGKYNVEVEDSQPLVRVQRKVLPRMIPHLSLKVIVHGQGPEFAISVQAS